MSELSDRDVEAIKEIHGQWISAELKRNRSLIIELCTNEVMWIPPNDPPILGKEAIGRYLDANQGDLRDVQIRDLVIRGADTYAYLTSNYCSRFVDEMSSEVQEAKGSHLWVLRKTAATAWQVAVVAWSEWKSG